MMFGSTLSPTRHWCLNVPKYCRSGTGDCVQNHSVAVTINWASHFNHHNWDYVESFKSYCTTSFKQKLAKSYLSPLSSPVVYDDWSDVYRCWIDESVSHFYPILKLGHFLIWLVNVSALKLGETQTRYQTGSLVSRIRSWWKSAWCLESCSASE